LRTAQHLDALEVHEVHDGAGRPAEHDVVDVDAHGGLLHGLEVSVADAADRRGDRGSPARAEVVDHDVRRPVADIDDVGGAVGRERVAADRADRERRLLQRFLAEARADDDFLEPGGLLGVLRERGAGFDRRRQGGCRG
jgi:hypothetical protein